MTATDDTLEDAWLSLEGGAFEDAISLTRELLAKDPDNVDALFVLGASLWETWAFEEARQPLQRARELDPGRGDIVYQIAMLLEHVDDLEGAERAFAEAEKLDPDAFPRPVRLSKDDFDAIVQAVRREITEPLDSKVDKVQIRVRDLPAREMVDESGDISPGLLGLYSGTALPDRSTEAAVEYPPMVFVFQRNLERVCADRDWLAKEIRVTVLHEIGHFLGLDENDLADRDLD